MFVLFYTVGDGKINYLLCVDDNNSPKFTDRKYEAARFLSTGAALDMKDKFKHGWQKTLLKAMPVETNIDSFLDTIEKLACL